MFWQHIKRDIDKNFFPHRHKKSAVQLDGALLFEDLFGILSSSHSASSSKVRFPARHSSLFLTASYCHCLNLSRLRAPLWTLAK